MGWMAGLPPALAARRLLGRTPFHAGPIAGRRPGGILRILIDAIGKGAFGLKVLVNLHIAGTTTADLALPIVNRSETTKTKESQTIVSNETLNKYTNRACHLWRVPTTSYRN